MAKNFSILITDTNHRLKQLRKHQPGKYKKKQTTYHIQNAKRENLEGNQVKKDILLIEEQR